MKKQIFNLYALNKDYQLLPFCPYGVKKNHEGVYTIFNSQIENSVMNKYKYSFCKSLGYYLHMWNNGQTSTIYSAASLLTAGQNLPQDQDYINDLFYELNKCGRDGLFLIEYVKAYYQIVLAYLVT